jgi:hypothetical protein
MPCGIVEWWSYKIVLIFTGPNNGCVKEKVEEYVWNFNALNQNMRIFETLESKTTIFLVL